MYQKSFNIRGRRFKHQEAIHYSPQALVFPLKKKFGFIQGSRLHFQGLKFTKHTVYGGLITLEGVTDCNLERLLLDSCVFRVHQLLDLDLFLLRSNFFFVSVGPFLPFRLLIILP